MVSSCTYYLAQTLNKINHHAILTVFDEINATKVCLVMVKLFLKTR